MRLILVTGLLLLASCATTSSDTSSSPANTAAETEVADAPKVRKICKREVPTGSHRTVVTCRTVEQIEKDREDARRIKNRTGSMGAGPIGSQ